MDFGLVLMKTDKPYWIWKNCFELTNPSIEHRFLVDEKQKV